MVTIAGNVTWVKGKGLVRHGGKSEAALRVVPLPSFASDLLQERLVLPGEDSWPLFPAVGRDGRITYRYPSNVRRTLRSVREEVGLGWMTPHTWRRTYATILDDELTLTDRMKADLMARLSSLRTRTSVVVSFMLAQPSSSMQPSRREARPEDRQLDVL